MPSRAAARYAKPPASRSRSGDRRSTAVRFRGCARLQAVYPHAKSFALSPLGEQMLADVMKMENAAGDQPQSRQR
ncbi:hypothetical protein M8494_04425 [Serratia ureilytica]